MNSNPKSTHISVWNYTITDTGSVVDQQKDVSLFLDETGAYFFEKKPAAAKNFCGPFFQKSPRSILRKSSVKVGGQKHTSPPYDGVCASSS